MYQASAILGMLSQTSLHAGTGQQTGTIDLPIQREGHNGSPCVFGSAVKGALRTLAEQKKAQQLKADGVAINNKEEYIKEVKGAEDIAVIFGPSMDKAADYAGAIIVTDARLLLFPVRSLTSQFKWVTCSDVLQRFLRDCQLLNVKSDKFNIEDITDTDNQSIAVVHTSVKEDSLFLEEYRFETDKRDLSKIIDALVLLMKRDNAKEALEKQLVIISNDNYAHLVNHATPVNAHIAIDAQTKIIKDGALWYEETLSPETLLYVGLSANDARKASDELEKKMPAKYILEWILGLFAERPWLQVGGNKTLGMGWCAIKTIQ